MLWQGLSLDGAYEVMMMMMNMKSPQQNGGEERSASAPTSLTELCLGPICQQLAEHARYHITSGAPGGSAS